jgi:hypothetical protein
MRDWSKDIEDAIASLNLSAAREAEVVEELSQHLNDRYDELLIAGVGEEQAYRILMQDLTDGKLVAGLKRPYILRCSRCPLAGRDARSSLPAFGTTCATAPACLSEAPALQSLQFSRWRWGLARTPPFFNFWTRCGCEPFRYRTQTGLPGLQL